MPFTITLREGENKRIIEAAEGMTLRQSLSQAGVFVDAPCGGRGRCGKCRVKVAGSVSAVTDKERSLLTPDELSTGIRLSCLARPEGNVEITLPQRQGVLIETGSIAELPSGGALHPLADGGGVGLAVDIGTTTLALLFYDLSSGRLLGTASALNPQREFGADVISRIAACSGQPDGLCLLRSRLLGGLNRMIGDFCRANGRSPEELRACVLAGNTAMLHIAAGLDPTSLAAAPYTPQSLFGHTVAARQAGLDILPDAPVYFTPCVSAYVGGDITSGLLACGFIESGDNVLFIDLGTNGEMVLRQGGRLLCCATAAGPVFEGAHIRDGVGSVEGAIRAVERVRGGLSVSTIGGKIPLGICGTGLIDAAAVMLKAGVIDETGRFCEDIAELADDDIRSRVVCVGEPKFLLDEQSAIGVTQKDIRELQLAKAAVAAGAATLLEAAGITARQVERVIIAGGLGTHVNPASACAIGLLPPGLEGRATAAGNTSAAGAASLLLGRENIDRIEKLARACEYIELSGNPIFNDLYIENMSFEI